MTPEQLVPLKRELAEALQATVARFNAANHENQIADFDALRSALGIRVVRPNIPSCFLEVEFQPARNSTLTVYCSRHRVRDFQRESRETYRILSDAGQRLIVDDVPQPVNADELAQKIIAYFTI